MKLKWVGGAALVLATAALGGCRHATSKNAAQVRLINAIPAQGPLSVAVAGETVWNHSAFGSNTGYQSIRPGAYTVQIATASHVASKSIAFDKGHKYTVLTLTVPFSRSVTFRIFTDDDTAPIPSGQARLYFINAAPVPAGVDLLLNNIVAFPHIAYAHRSEPLLLNVGTYEVKLNRSDEVATLAGPLSLDLTSGHTYTLVAMGQNQNSLNLGEYPNDP